jgi:catechol 2,3-dioxygenase-like lactoylglutathione lyase family enzyme
MEEPNHTLESAPKLNGLVETALFVENLPQASDFYEQVLGLSKITDSDRGCVFRLADQRYLLLVTHEGARTPNETPSGSILPPCALPQHDGRGPGHIAFGVSSAVLDSWRARLEKHHVEILSEVTWESGARSLYFRDPDGHMIELATPGIWEAPRSDARCETLLKQLGA